MSEEKKKQDMKDDKTSSKQPAKSKKTGGKKPDKKKVVPKAKKTSGSEKSALTRKEIDKLILEHADMQAKYKEYQSNYLLLAAEFENFKKRIIKDQQRSREIYKESLLSELLPVVDDIDRALQHHTDKELNNGLSMIRTKLLSYLEKYEVVPFESLGEEFDPDKHDAMLTRSIKDEKDNIIIEEFQKGYMIEKKVLRHAKVVVNILE
ncbi:MAG: nucleotide exchange factor GrpE [Candidatus Marinimicrobia bacterium]|nr:nucleotide exchange factor GrpE [Candidatus Neomarinimicrobiota bacterium]